MDGNVFSQDNLGNLIGVHVFDDGEPAVLSGTVSGNVIRADGGTVAVSGTLNRNDCYIILPAAAYAIPGPISIIVKLSGGGSDTTLCAVVANVYQSSTDAVIDPGTIIPSISALIAEIAAAVATIPEDYSDLSDAIEVIGEKKPNFYDFDNVVLGKNWAGGYAANRAYVQIPVKEGNTYTIVIPNNAVISQVAVIQLTNVPSPLGSFYIVGGNRASFTAVTNCVNIRIQFEGDTTLSASDFNSYNVQVFEGTNEYFSAIDKIARSKLLNEYKKYIFIGDSYCEGYNPDGNVTGWGERLKTAMGLSNDNCIVKCKGGTGFYHASDGKTFSTLLDEAGVNIDKETITDIVVCGGWNDKSETLNHVYFDGVLAFATKVKNEYPNAVLHVGMIGASNDSAVKQRLQNIVLFSYQYGALRSYYNYLNLTEYALSENNLASDGIHPNADGQVEITIAIKQALETGCAGLLYRFYNTIKTS